MQRIPDKSIDMILCDLPYGTTRNKWDTVIPLDRLWLQYKRIIKTGGAIVLFSQQPFTSTLAMSNIEQFRYEWVWEKQIATGHLNARKMPLKKHENILVFYDKLPTYNPQMAQGAPYVRLTGAGSSNYGNYKQTNTVNNGNRYPTTILKFTNDRGLHPTQKPVELCEYLIKTYTDAGEIVLDNCIGSGTTAVACLNTGRNYIGFENNDDYYQISVDRIKENTRQERLF